MRCPARSRWSASLAAQQGNRGRAEELMTIAMRAGFGLQFTSWPVERNPYLAMFRDTQWFDAHPARGRFLR